MNKIKLYLAYFVAFIIIVFSAFLCGKKNERDNINKNSFKKAIKAKDVDSLSFVDLVNILSKRVHK